MHFAALLSTVALLLSASATPIKRDVDIETVTEIDIVTEMVTAVVWVDPTGAPNAVVVYPSGPAELAPMHSAIVPYHSHHAYNTLTSSTEAAPALSTPAPAPLTTSSSTTSSTSSTSTSTTSSTSTPAPAPPPAPPTTTSPPYVAPAPTSEYVAPAPVAPTTTTQAPPPPPPPAAAPTTPAAAPTQASSSPSGSTYSGDITYYTVGLGSCGNTNTDSEFVVAMSAAMMNKATMCGKSITLSYGGITQTATVVDTCPGCASGSLDLSPALFSAIAPNGDGRVHGVQWWFN